MAAWLRLSIAGAATLLVGMGLGRFSYSPMIPALIGLGALTESQAGTVGASNFAGYLLGALAATSMRRRWGEAATLRLCLAGALAALAASILPWGFLWLLFWRGLAGAAVGVMMIYALAIATRHAPPGKLGAATGIVYTGVGVGILLSGTLVPWLLQHGLAAAWSGVAVVGVASAAIGFWGWRAAGTDAAAPSAASPLAPESAIAWSMPVVGLMLARTLFTIGLIPHTIYWVDYLVRGLGRDMAFGGAQWALFGVGAICGTYLWGRLADRIGFRAGLSLAFAAVAAGVALPVLVTGAWALAASSLVVGAQPGLTAIQAVAGYLYVTLFALTGSYTPIFLAGGAAMALGAAVSFAMVKPAIRRAPG